MILHIILKIIFSLILNNSYKILTIFVFIAITISCSEKQTIKTILVAGTFTAKETFNESKSGHAALSMYIDVDKIFIDSNSNTNNDKYTPLTWNVIDQLFFTDGGFDGMEYLSKEARDLLGKKIIISGSAYDYCKRKVLLKPPSDPNESCFIYGAYNHIELKNITKQENYKSYLSR